jgi:hypothetical protein
VLSRARLCLDNRTGRTCVLDRISCSNIFLASPQVAHRLFRDDLYSWLLCYGRLSKSSTYGSQWKLTHFVLLFTLPYHKRSALLKKSPDIDGEE